MKQTRRSRAAPVRVAPVQKKTSTPKKARATAKSAPKLKGLMKVSRPQISTSQSAATSKAPAITPKTIRMIRAATKKDAQSLRFSRPVCGLHPSGMFKVPRA